MSFTLIGLVVGCYWLFFELLATLLWVLEPP